MFIQLLFWILIRFAHFMITVWEALLPLPPLTARYCYSRFQPIMDPLLPREQYPGPD